MVSFFCGVHHLYYSASSFGSNRSCIDHGTSARLGQEPFTDLGSVLVAPSAGGRRRLSTDEAA